MEKQVKKCTNNLSTSIVDPKQLMRLETERLILREVMPEDGAMLREYSLEPASREFDMPDPLSQWEFEQIAVWMVDEQKVIPRTYYYLAVTLKAHPEMMLGSVHLTIQSHARREGEIGYLLGTAHHRHGYATEASRALMKFGFNTLSLMRISAADIVTDNIASVRVSEKLGMRAETVRPAAQFFHGRWWDTVTYAITKEEWRKQNAPAAKQG
jgi:RimJ/RimL family protein N-acetyltransferase